MKYKVIEHNGEWYVQTGRTKKNGDRPVRKAECEQDAKEKCLLWELYDLQEKMDEVKNKLADVAPPKGSMGDVRLYGDDSDSTFGDLMC